MFISCGQLRAKNLFKKRKLVLIACHLLGVPLQKKEMMMTMLFLHGEPYITFIYII